MHLLFDPLMDAAAGLGAGLDWKTSLQELVRRALASACPEYVIEDDGPDHAKTFVAQVRVGDADLRPRRRPLQEGGRAAGRRDGVPRHRRGADRRRLAAAVADPAPSPTPDDRTRLADRCPSSPRSRSSAAAWPARRGPHASPPSRCCTPARCAVTWPGRPTSPTRLAGRRVTARPPPRQVPLARRWTTATPSSATSG